ncbi:MAG: hypothetical protein CMH57_04820 [Myxococcales bacterium]|nr:hypothetical protein [Myxococcales bacterium]
MTMTHLHRALFFGLLAASLLAFTACGSVTAPSIQGQVDEVRQLNGQLSGQWSDFNTTIDKTTAALNTLPSIDVDPNELDMPLLKKAIEECFQSPAKVRADAATGGGVATGETMMNTASAAAKAAPTCDTESTAALNDLKSKSEPDVARFIDSKLATTAMIRDNVKGRLPTLAEEMTLTYPEAKARAAALRVTVDKIKSTADGLPLPEPAKVQFNSEYQAFVSELTLLEETIAKVEKEAPALQGRIATAKERMTYNLANFGETK